MAGTATDFTGGAETGVMKKFVTEFDLVIGLGIVGGNRYFR
jgi:hypothetical protein